MTFAHALHPSFCFALHDVVQIDSITIIAISAKSFMTLMILLQNKHGLQQVIAAV